MAVQIPEELKAGVPQTWFGKMLAATPVVLAVVSTLLAGLASSEMTKAQYDRSLGAQRQSKAGDQWSFFQAKRLRGAYQSSTAEIIRSLAPVRPFDPAALRSAAQDHADLATLLRSQAAEQTLEYLQRAQLPPLPEAPPMDPAVKAALEGVTGQKDDAQMAVLLAKVSDDMLDAAVRQAQDQTERFEAITAPINAMLEQLEAAIAHLRGPAAPGEPSLARDFALARLQYAAARYEAEARLNQVIAHLYELQVRKANRSAERHHARSQQFFIGMLAAQLGVIVSTFALAAKKRNILWSFATAVGLLAVAFAVYVYLYI